MSLYYSIEVKGVLERPSSPDVEIHNWVDQLHFKDVSKVEIKRRVKNLSQKGPNFERSFCKNLSLWVTSGKDENIFWRSVGSGGRATRKQLSVHLGDVACFPEKVATGQWFLDLFVVELKNRNLSIGEVFKKPFEWFLDTGRKCQLSNVSLLPLIIMKDGAKLLTFTHINIIKDLSRDYFTFADNFALFDFNIVLNTPVEDAMNLWRSYYNIKEMY